MGNFIIKKYKQYKCKSKKSSDYFIYESDYDYKYLSESESDSESNDSYNICINDKILELVQFN